MIPEVGWMFDEDIGDDTVAAMLDMSPLQWALISMTLAVVEEPVL